MDLNKILNMVSGLLAKAESTTFPEEADAFRAKAAELMAKYRIEEEQLLAEDAKAAVPIMEAFDLCSARSPFTSDYFSLAYWSARFAGVRIRDFYDANERKYVVKAVGYAGDVRLFHLLYNAAFLTFQQRLEPKIDPTLTEVENIYFLRASGKTRAEVATMLWGSSATDGAAHGKVGKIYKAECARRGETPALSGKGIDLTQFRKSYAEWFIQQFYSRLKKAGDAADSATGGMVLHGRAERVTEAFYSFFPDLRPAPVEDAPVAVKEEAMTEWVDQRTPAQIRRDEAREAKRVQKEYYSPAARAGRRAGVAAANDVPINGVESAKRLA